MVKADRRLATVPRPGGDRQAGYQQRPSCRGNDMQAGEIVDFAARDA